MKPQVIINGKFLRAESTGVHRVAMELANALADLKNEEHPAVAPIDFEVWHSRDGLARASEIRLPTRCLSRFEGIIWEQITLPRMQGRKLLLNLCNVGPVASANAMTMIHDVQVHLTPQSYTIGFRLWYHLIQPILGRRNRRIVTVSEFSKQQIARVGLCDAKRIGVVHNGVDHVLRIAADHDIGPRMKLEPQRYVVALSTTQAHKNIRVLLGAFSAPGMADETLVLVGGTDAAAFAACKLAVPLNVVFAGRVSDGELRSLLENALCLAFPSTTEGFGLPPLEAMLAGCPALVAACGAIPEVCGDAAIYVAPDDPGAWISAVQTLLADKRHRAARVKAGRKHAAAFTWRAAALSLVSELQKVL